MGRVNKVRIPLAYSGWEVFNSLFQHEIQAYWHQLIILSWIKMRLKVQVTGSYVIGLMSPLLEIFSLRGCSTPLEKVLQTDSDLTFLRLCSFLTFTFLIPLFLHNSMVKNYKIFDLEIRLFDEVRDMFGRSKDEKGKGFAEIKWGP